MSRSRVDRRVTTRPSYERRCGWTRLRGKHAGLATKTEQPFGEEGRRGR